jgi:hypothetical protein
MDDLQKRFGTWLVPWGDINRYQRLAKFDDNEPSLPVGIAAATWGSLPSFGSRKYPYTNKRYGSYGNSFVACVEFGKKVKAKTIVTGGQSFDRNQNIILTRRKCILMVTLRMSSFIRKMC